MKIYVIPVSVLLLLIVSMFAANIVVEPNQALAVTASSSAVVTLNVTAGISITSPGNTTMSTNLGVSQNTAVASSTWTVATNDSTGYTLTVNATSTPAMQSGSNNIADYPAAASTTPETWNVPSNSAAFGYSAYGTDTATGTWGTGANCQSAPNVNSTTLKYLGFRGANTQTIATRSATTTPSGVATTVCYAVQQNNFYIPSGTYTATVVATAVAL